MKLNYLTRAQRSFGFWVAYNNLLGVSFKSANRFYKGSLLVAQDFLVLASIL